MPRRRRTPLPLSPRGQFIFTERTTSVDISRVYHPDAIRSRVEGSTLLHVGRSRGALEFPKSGRPAVEVDAATVLSLLEIENQYRATARGLKPTEREPVAVDPDVLSRLRTVAKQSRGPALPLAGRPRRCWESGGTHPGEWLWMDTETGDSVIETRTPTLDDRGNAWGYSSSTRPVSADVALEWLRVEGASFLPGVLLKVAGKDIADVLYGPSEPFKLTGKPKGGKRPKPRRKPHK
jgi:hypothetical protein